MEADWLHKETLMDRFPLLVLEKCWKIVSKSAQSIVVFVHSHSSLFNMSSAGRSCHYPLYFTSSGKYTNFISENGHMKMTTDTYWFIFPTASTSLLYYVFYLSIHFCFNIILPYKELHACIYATLNLESWFC